MLLGLGLALVVAFLASRYVFLQLRRAQSGSAGSAVKLAQVVVAAGPLKLGQRLTPDDLKLVGWPADQVPKGSFSRKEDCVGRALIAPVVEDETILEQRLAPREAGAGLVVAIPPGLRAMSVGVDDVVAVAGFVAPGTIVDVMVTGGSQGGPVTRTILEHVRVLAVGQQVQADINGKPQTAPVVTLLVTPEQAERLALAAANGKIHLVLRNTADMTDVNPAPVYGPAVFTGAVAPAPKVAARVPHAPPPPPPHTVEVIRGGKVETQQFPN
jgi:pilus assembly protein CpaB